MQEIHESGYKIVIFSNQALIKSALTGKGATKFKAKVDSILKAAGVPAAVLAATMKDEFRKPETGMWHFFVEKCNGKTGVDKDESYYVGDAAGREYDFADTDKAFAKAVSLKFKTPEEVFGESAFTCHCLLHSCAGVPCLF